MQIERRARAPRMLLQVRHVIAVMMGDDDGVEAARKNVVAEGTHRANRFFWADSGVDQNAHALRFDHDGVARRATGENEDAHAPTLFCKNRPREPYRPLRQKQPRHRSPHDAEAWPHAAVGESERLPTLIHLLKDLEIKLAIPLDRRIPDIGVELLNR